GRLEHWTVATATGRLVAHSIVGSPAPAPAPAYFWTDQFDSRLQVVGHPGPGLAVQLDESAGGFVARYRDAAGRVVAIALLDRPELLAQAREELPGGAAHRSPRGAAAA
ncbi:MAG TPA: oxidoreductase C-terminal domain-containing protein, partial [Gaiellales bacterium]|nr:oxidoreductase C-terminal domain-containing protein [Gaiellales bacterium]